MRIMKFEGFLKGYIIVRVEGINPEKFINMASRNGISLCDIDRINYTTIQLKMNPNEYRLLKDITKKTNTKISIKKKEGLNFLFYKFSKRKFFTFGIAIFTCIMLYMSSLVLNIEIYGNKKVNTEKIYKAVKNAGLIEGKIKYKINLRDVESKVLKEINEISMINIKFLGTKAKVEVIEREMPPIIEKDNIATNIVANKDGIILKILTYRGQRMVDVGDFVKKGQILISGVILDNNNVPSSIVRAKGKIIARTWYEAIKEIPLDYKYNERTGKVKIRSYIILAGKRIYTKKDNISFEKYDKIEEKNKAGFIGKLGLEKVTEYYYEKIEKSKKLNYNQAVEIAQNLAEDDIRRRIPNEPKIIDKKVEKVMGNNKATVKVLYILEEVIGSEEEIR